MMKPDDGHRNSVIIRHNLIDFGFVGFVLTIPLALDGNQGLSLRRKRIKACFKIYFLYDF